MEGRSLERKAVMGAEANVANAGVQSMGKVASAGFQADAIKAAGAAQGQASMASGIGSMASGIAGGIGSMPTGGSSDRSYGGLGGKYGTPTSGSYTDYNLAIG
jgi:hypothetical protein